MSEKFPQPGENSEQQASPELKEQAEAFDARAGAVGDQLESVGPLGLNQESSRKVIGALDRVVGGIYMLTGSAAAASMWTASLDAVNPLSSPEQVIAALGAAIGITVGVNGFHKLLNGSKKFFEKLPPEQKSQASS